MKFSSDFDTFEEDDSEWIKEELPGLFQTLIFAIVVLLVLITVIRPIALKAFEIRKPDGLGGETGGGEGSHGVINAQTMPNTSDPNAVAAIPPAEGEAPEVTVAKVDPIVKVNEIADSSPQDLVNALRKWLNEES